MKLIVQPDAGIAPIVTAIKQAKKSVDVLIFRLDRTEIARALEAAVARGVRVCKRTLKLSKKISNLDQFKPGENLNMAITDETAIELVK